MLKLIPITLILTLTASRLADSWRGYDALGGEILIPVIVLLGRAIWEEKRT